MSTNLKAAFKALPHIQQVWMDEKGGFHLEEKKGCDVVTRAEAEEMEDCEPEVAITDEAQLEQKKIMEMLQSQNEQLRNESIANKERADKALQQLADKDAEIKTLNDEKETAVKTIQESLEAAEKDITELKAENETLKAEAEKKDA